MNLSEAIKPADLQGALQRQNISEGSFKPGDAIFFRTGWSRTALDQEQRRVQRGVPGHRARRREVDRPEAVCVAGADTWPVEVVPGENPNRPFICHQELITKHGIFLHENMDLSELGKDRVYEFVYVIAPSGSRAGPARPGRPIAII